MLASFHLVRYPPGPAAGALLAHGPGPAAAARATPGLRFWRLLGTGRGETMTLSADLRRWALFAVWDDDAALDAFLETSPVARALARRRAPTRCGWRRCAATAPGAARTRSPAPRPRRHTDGPVAILTRAAIRPRRAARLLPRDRRARPRALRAAGPARVRRRRRVAAAAPGDVLALERPRRRPGVRLRRPVHREVVRRTRAEDWYREELFARFAPYGAEGTWDGVTRWLTRATLRPPSVTSGSPPPG